MSGKKKNKQHLNSSLPSSSSSSSSSSLLTSSLSSFDLNLFSFKILFQGKKSEIENKKKFLINLNDFKRLSIRSGTSIILQTDLGIKIIGNLWPSNTTPSGNITISRFWSSCFLNKQGQIIKDITRNSILPCSNMIIQITSTLPLEEFQTSSFRIYLLTVLGDLLLFEKTILNLSWRGFIIQCQVEKLKHIDNLQLEIVDSPAYQISSSTNIKIITTNDSISSLSNVGTAILLEDTIAQSIPNSNLTLSTDSIILNERINWESLSFAGYASEINEAKSIIESGLGLTSNVNNNNNNNNNNNVIINNQEDNIDLFFNRLKKPRGLLLTGPRGTGKTLLMNSLANYYRPFYNSIHTLSPDILLSRYQGEAEKKLQLLFTSAKQNSPSIILIDDVDLLCCHRSGSTNEAANGNMEVQRRVLSCLLTLLDGIVDVDNNQQSENPIIFLICTSSNPGNIDSAMRRPGRIDKEIELVVPTPEDREKILTKILLQMNVIINQNSNISDNEISIKCIHEISKKAHGMVGSDLLLLCKEAFSISLQKQSNGFFSVPFNSINITESDLYQALTRVNPSGIREVSVEVPEVRWNDIGGMDSVKQSIREVVEWPLQYPELFQSMGVQPPRGVLLYGPPGCSKTLMAKALATESGLNFLTVRGPELLSKWLGDSEKAVQKLFHRAKSCAPSLIFFDEIDAFATKRGDTSSGVNDRVLAQLLTEIDGGGGRVYQNSKRVVVVAATNRPDMLDPALLRPGRIDRKIYVPPPDELSRQQIFENNLKKMPHENDIDILNLVAMSQGYSGAEVVSACMEAAILAINEKSEKVGNHHFYSAMANIKPQITQSMLDYYLRMSKQFYT